MENIPDTDGLYPIPCQIRSRMKWQINVLSLFIIAFFLGILILLLSLPERWSFIPLEAGVAVCALLFIVLWLYGILRVSCLSLDEDTLCLKTLFGTKTIRWDDVGDIGAYEMKNYTQFGLATRSKTAAYETAVPLRKLFMNRYSILIQLAQFPDADAEKLYATIASMRRRAAGSTSETAEDGVSQSPAPEIPQKQKSNASALLLSAAISVAFAVIYGISLLLLKKNYIMIPYLGMILMFVVYNAKIEKDRLPVRLVFALLCALQPIAGIFLFMMISLSAYFPAFGVFGTFRLCVGLIGQKPSDFWAVYLSAALLFLFGAFLGKSFRLTRRLHKLMMKRRNGYSVVKEKRSIRIYLIDYEFFDQGAEKLAVSFGSGQCLVRQEGRETTAFYLPAEVLDGYRIDASTLSRETRGDRDYCVIDLGGDGEIRSYGYPCTLICDLSGKPEEFIPGAV